MRESFSKLTNMKPIRFPTLHSSNKAQYPTGACKQASTLAVLASSMLKSLQAALRT